MAFSYREIGRLIPVSKGTLSGWCRDLALTPHEMRLLEQRQKALIVQGQVGRSRRYVTRDRAEERRALARAQVSQLKTDPFWVAGLTAYWAEGAKRTRSLSFSNSDPDRINLFLAWGCKYLVLSPDRFTVRLHLHAGQDESERRRFWCESTSLSPTQFRKSFVKPEGSGHRKNILYNGTAQVRVTKSTALLDQVLGWIEGFRDAFVFSG